MISVGVWASAGFQFFQVQFELIEQRPRSLRAMPELLAAKFGDPQLEMGDFRLLAGKYRFQRRGRGSVSAMCLPIT